MRDQWCRPPAQGPGYIERNRQPVAIDRAGYEPARARLGAGHSGSAGPVARGATGIRACTSRPFLFRSRAARRFLSMLQNTWPSPTAGLPQVPGHEDPLVGEHQPSSRSSWGWTSHPTATDGC